VKVYAGIDPLTSKRHYLTEVIPTGPDAAKEAKTARTRLINQVNEQRNPRTKATVNQLMDRYLELLDVDVTTRKDYEGYIRLHIRPLLGELQVGRLDGETLDSFYSILRRCQAHCDGRPFIETSIGQDGAVTLGEAHQDPPAAAHRAGRGHGDPTARLPRPLRRRRP
jgi:integrase